MVGLDVWWEHPMISQQLLRKLRHRVDLFYSNPLEQLRGLPRAATAWLAKKVLSARGLRVCPECRGVQARTRWGDALPCRMCHGRGVKPLH